MFEIYDIYGKKEEKKTSGKGLLIFFGTLLFVGFLCGRNILESSLIIVGVFGLCFLIVGSVFALIYFFE